MEVVVVVVVDVVTVVVTYGVKALQVAETIMAVQGIFCVVAWCLECFCRRYLLFM